MQQVRNGEHVSHVDDRRRARDVREARLALEQRRTHGLRAEAGAAYEPGAAIRRHAQDRDSRAHNVLQRRTPAHRDLADIARAVDAQLKLLLLGAPAAHREYAAGRGSQHVHELIETCLLLC